MTSPQTPRPLRVLIGTDGSPAASVAVDFVAGVPWPAGSHVSIIQTIEVPTVTSAVPGSSLAFVDVEDVEAGLRATAQKTVDAARERLAAAGVSAEGHVLVGRAATTLADEAAVTEADLIVVGSRGHGPIESMLLGSVSAELIDRARTAVLVARTASADRTILAWDGSAGARSAARLIESWPIFADSTVRVVTVTDTGSGWWGGAPEPGTPNLVSMQLEAARAARARDHQLAVTMCEELRDAGVDAEPENREGDPADQILAATRPDAADLIVMGTRGRTGLARLVLGSVARNVVTHAACSVLVVHEVVAPRGPSRLEILVPAVTSSGAPAGQGSDGFLTPWGDPTTLS